MRCREKLFHVLEVANRDSNDVMKFRASDAVILGTYSVAVHLQGLLFDGVSIWITATYDAVIQRLNVTDGSEV